VEDRTARLGPDHLETLSPASLLAEAYRTAGRWAESVPNLKQVLEKQRTICGPTHDSTLQTMHNLAMNYAEVGRFPESIELHETVLRARRSTRCPEHPSITWCLRTFAQACQRAGQLDRADQLLREALELERKREDSLSRRNGEANTLGWLATNLLLQGRYDDAELFARAAVAMNQCEERRHYDWVSLLGAVLVAREKCEEAEPLLLQAYEGMKKQEVLLTADERRRLAEAGKRVVQFYELTNQPEKVREWRQKLLATK
jgi:tetratricopeptide (TPR) repeat protein